MASIESNAYIQTEEKKYYLQKAEGIKIYPERTHMYNPGETITFKLYFPLIPKDTKFFAFIESLESKWQIFGIKLEDN